MNEFKTIMQGWRNLCEAQEDCDSCPMRAKVMQCAAVDHLTDATIGDIEKAVLKESPVWIYDNTPLGRVYVCSKCGDKSNRERKFCPECGSRMML